MSQPARLRVGLIVNPYAGLGGALALKGSDDVATQALATGAQPMAGERARMALQMLHSLWDRIGWWTGEGPMGGEVLSGLGLSPGTIYPANHPKEGLTSSAADTTELASRLSANRLDLLIFCGGDGTARDVLRGVSSGVPTLGIPAGVKMQSAVFGRTPKDTGVLAKDFLAHSQRAVSELEVMDLDEAGLRQGKIHSRLFGYMTVPASPRRLQGKKVPTPDTDSAIVASIAQRVVDSMVINMCYLIGPGSTTYAVKNALQLKGSLLGVDVVRNGVMLCQDATESQLWAFTQTGPCHVLSSCIGGQGHVFGRGNQQFSPRVLKAIQSGHLTVLASPAKLQSLRGRPFCIDSGDPQTDELFSRPVRVWTGYRDDVWYQIQGSEDAPAPIFC